MAHEILVTLTRGNLEESHHRGAYCVVKDGAILRSRGDIATPVFTRSSIKSIQALAVVESGAPDRFGLTEAELAITVGSHSGSPLHTATAKSILDKAGESESLLRCGGHPSFDAKVHAEYIRTGHRPGRVEDNCSGKHAGMIAAAKARGEDCATYYEISHPLQQFNLENLAALSEIDKDRIGVAIDGCGVPSFAVPLSGLARAAAHYGLPDEMPSDLAGAARRVTDAVLKHPEMVAGDGRFDTEMMRVGKGRILSKMGAEGVQFVSLIGERLGFAVKIDDGGRRAVRAVTCALLIDLGYVDVADVADLFPHQVTTREGTPVGDIKVRL